MHKLQCIKLDEVKVTQKFNYTYKEIRPGVVSVYCNGHLTAILDKPIDEVKHIFEDCDGCGKDKTG